MGASLRWAVMFSLSASHPWKDAFIVKIYNTCIFHLISGRAMTVAPTSTAIRVQVLWSLWRNWTSPSRLQRSACQPCNTSKTWTRGPLRRTAMKWQLFTRTASRKGQYSTKEVITPLFSTFRYFKYVLTDYRKILVERLGHLDGLQVHKAL